MCSGNLSFGHAPSAYLEMVDSMLQGAGVYDDDLDPLIGEATGNGAWNVRLGRRESGRSRGLELVRRLHVHVRGGDALRRRRFEARHRPADPMARG